MYKTDPSELDADELEMYEWAKTPDHPATDAWETFREDASMVGSERAEGLQEDALRP